MTIKKYRIYLLLTLFLTMLLFTSGCKEEKQLDIESVVGWNKSDLFVEEPVKAPLEGDIVSAKCVGDYLIYVLSTEEGESIVVNNTFEKTCKEQLKLKRGEYSLADYNISPDGEVVVLACKYIYPESYEESEEGTILSEEDDNHIEEIDEEPVTTEYVVIQIKGDGEPQYTFLKDKIDISRLDECSDPLIINCGSGEIIIGIDSYLLILNSTEDTVCIEPKNNEEIYGLVLYSEKTLLLKYGRGIYSVFDIEKGSIIKEISDIEWSCNPYIDKNGTLYVYDQTKLYYVKEGDVKTPLIYWSDYGIDGSAIANIFFSEEKLHCVMRLGLSDWKDAFFTDNTENRSVESETVELTIGCIYNDSAFQNAVSAFNKSGGNVRVKIKDYTEAEGIPPINALYNDMLAGNGPDLIQICLGETDVNNLIRANMLEKLTPYMDSSQVIKAEDFIPSFLEALEVDGAVYYCPTNFFLNCLYGHYDNANPWFLEDFLNYIKSNKDKENSMSKENYISYIAVNALLNDKDAERAGRDVEIIVDTLRNWESSDYYNPDYSIRKEGKLILNSVSWMSATDYLTEKSTWGGGVIKGFPNVEGSGCYFVPDNSYAISSTCTNKEAAWKFIEYFFTDEGREKGTPWWLFSSNEKLFEEQLKTVTRSTDNDGQPIFSYMDEDLCVDVMPGTEKEIDELRQVVYNTKCIRKEDKELYNIISEESEYYINGEKNRDEVVEVIIGRLKSYYGERE
ncbi:MAG: extracellular solute-binding protein [Lachnospiraceae bacterium]|nr:extracellular solute-binding protein [Lachnospiraceae bacterium]